VPQSRHRKSKARKRPKGTYQAPIVKPQTVTKSSNDRKLRIGAIILVAVLTVGLVTYVIFNRRGQAGAAAGPEVTTASGLRYKDLVVGTGPSPQRGQTVTVNYTGTLEDGTKFDSSFDAGKPANFLIGVGRVIKGWDEGLMSMKVGGKRQLFVPSRLGYGAAGNGPKIPPNSDLVFEVELLGVK